MNRLLKWLMTRQTVCFIRHFWCCTVHLEEMTAFNKDGYLSSWDYIYLGKDVDSLRCRRCGYVYA